MHNSVVYSDLDKKYMTRHPQSDPSMTVCEFQVIQGQYCRYEATLEGYNEETTTGWGTKNCTCDCCLLYKLSAIFGPPPCTIIV